MVEHLSIMHETLGGRERGGEVERGRERKQLVLINFIIIFTIKKRIGRLGQED
jgi:hypothetical protein